MVSLRPGRTSVTLNARCRFDTQPPLVFDAPGGLVPLRIAVYELDEYRIKNGWPVEVPDHDIRATTLCSAEGEMVTLRPVPDQIRTDALMRWIADDEQFNIDDLTWRALQRGADLEWKSSVEYMPSFISDYTYRVHSEVFTRRALNFDSDTRNHMWMDMSTVMNPTGVTVIMVLSPNSAYGNDVSVPYNGIWCFGTEPPGTDIFDEVPNGSWFDITLMGNFIYLETDQTPKTRGPGLNDQLTSNSPMYLVLSLTRPNSFIYVGSGPSSMNRVAIPTGIDQFPLDNKIVLGRSTGDVLHTADMALFEVGLYSDVLTDSQVMAEVAKLSRCYGGDR